MSLIFLNLSLSCGFPGIFARFISKILTHGSSCMISSWDLKWVFVTSMEFIYWAFCEAQNSSLSTTWTPMHRHLSTSVQLGKYSVMDGELKHLKMAPVHRHLIPGLRVKLALSNSQPSILKKKTSLNKLALVYRWQIDCQRSLKVCHGWKPSTVIAELARSLNFLSCWQWPLPFELYGTITPWGTQHDFVIVQMKLKTLSILGYGTGTTELQVIYMSAFLLWNHW